MFVGFPESWSRFNERRATECSSDLYRSKCGGRRIAICIACRTKVQCLLLTKKGAMPFAYRRRCNTFCLPKKMQEVLLTEEGAIRFAYRRRCNKFCLPKKVQYVLLTEEGAISFVY